MNEQESKFWFPRYGLIWNLPTTWQGWVVVATHITLLIAGFVAFVAFGVFQESLELRGLYFAAVTASFLAALYLKGERRAKPSSEH
jgi:hypothetical protein